MARFTKSLRQKIIKEFCASRNLVQFDARLFEQHVREAGPDHAAYGWFEWDDSKAALEHRIWQARIFAQGLKITFQVEDIGRGKVTVREVEMPMLLSPLDQRRSGGGYFISNPDNPEHMDEFCLQAATDLERWLRRYGAALSHAGGSVASVERQLKLLQAKIPQEVEEAA